MIIYEKKAPSNDEALITRRMVFISSDPGAIRTHDQRLKRSLPLPDNT